jgi:hypothetical protein
MFVSFWSFRKEGEESLRFFVVLLRRTPQNDIDKQPLAHAVTERKLGISNEILILC